MSNKHLKNTYELIKEMKHSPKNKFSLRVRLFAFFSFFLLSIVSGVLLILALTGVFNQGTKECYTWLESELTHLNTDVYRDFGKLSVEGIQLANQISDSLEHKMKDLNISASTIHQYPEYVETLLASQMDTLLQSLKASKSSGIYMILDATVNPELESSNNSKAGIFLKSTEPNIVNSIDMNVRYLRGPAHIARESGIQLLPQWKPEFDISKETFYDTTINTAKALDLPLSRLYYWSNRLLLVDNSESGMLLCVPLISENNTVYGICGYEVSSMLFKLCYSPDNTIYPRVFSTLSPISDQTMDIKYGLLAGNYYMMNALSNQSVLIHYNKKTFHRYTAKDQTYGGLSRFIDLYPSDSAYAHESHALAVMMPQEDLLAYSNSTNQKLYFFLCLLIVLSFITAGFISKRYIQPVIGAINRIKEQGLSVNLKTYISEIDDLIEFLTKQEEPIESPINSSPSAASNTALFESFVQNIKTLTNAERAVFDLYIKGHTAQEIANILYLSINTIKTHNKRIYMKLNVSSRKELLVFIRMMQELDKIKPPTS